MKSIIDLTHVINDRVSVYPGDEIHEITQIASVKEDGCKITSLKIISHLGTHIDAPSHVIEGGQNLDDMDISAFIGTAYVLDCTKYDSYHENIGKNKAGIDDVNQQVKSESHIGAKIIEEHKPKIENVDFLLLYTGNHEYWGTNEYIDKLRILTPESAKLITSLDVKGVGIDGISFDKVGATNLDIHNILLSKNILLIENLNNLNQIKGAIVNFSCLPIFYENADGSPVRAIAWKP